MRYSGALAVIAAIVAGDIGAHLLAQSSRSDTSIGMPRYDADGALQLPEDYLRWTLVGTALGLSYNEEVPRRESFNTTLMEPTAYDHFVRTGEFREGTMLALLVRGTEDDAMPARHGRFAGRTTISAAVAGPVPWRNRSRRAKAATTATSSTRRATTCSCSSIRCSPMPLALNLRSTHATRSPK